MRICPNEILTVVHLVPYIREGSFKLEVPIVCDLPSIQKIKVFEDDKYIVERCSYRGGKAREGLNNTWGKVVPQVAKGEIVVSWDMPCFTTDGDWGDFEEVCEWLVTWDKV